MSARQRSPIWNFFSIVDKDNLTAKCDICAQKMCYKSSTSNLKRHLERKHPTVKLIQNNDQEQHSSILDSSPHHQVYSLFIYCCYNTDV